MMEDLTQVKYIGPSTAEKLKNAGINSVAELAVKRPEELREILGFSLRKCKEIVNDALEKSWDKIAKPYLIDEYEQYWKENVKRIPTGSASLDKLLKGGFPTSSINILTGEYASGKTEMCYQVVVNCKKHYNRGAIWIETEAGTFVPDRLKEIAKAQNVEFKKEDLYVFPSFTIGDSPHFLFLSYLKATKILEKKGKEIGVLVVDSFTSKFRGYYTGREMLPLRAEEEQRHINYLNYLASKYNLAVMLTAQVMELPDQSLQLMQKAKTGQIKKMWGGTPVEHGGTYIIYLRRASKEEWEAIVADAPDVPPVGCRFKITKSGIRD